MDHDEAQACFEPEDAQCAPPPQVSTPPAEEPTACAGPPTAEVEKARAQLYQSMYDHNDTAGEYANKDPALDPIKAAINNPDLSSAERAQMMLDYRDKQMQDVDRDAMNAMKANDPNYALNAGGKDPGMHKPLLDKLASDPKMQDVMADLAQRIATTDPKELDIKKIFADTQKSAAGTADPDNEVDAKKQNLMALQAMATLANASRMKDDDPSAAKLPPELLAQIKDASEILNNNSASPDGAPLSHGVPNAPAVEGDKPFDQGLPFSVDNNKHFWSHAYLTADLMQKPGVTEAEAKAMSAFIGAQYELKPGSLGEGQGNSGLKDIAMNAEGAAFGAALMNDPTKQLPDKYDGPPVEDRSYPDTHPSKFDKATKEVAEDGNDLSKTNLVWHAIKGWWNSGDSTPGSGFPPVL